MKRGENMTVQDLYTIMVGEEHIELYDFVNHSILYSGDFKELPLKFYDLHVYSLSSDFIDDDNSMIFITVKQ